MRFELLDGLDMSQIYRMYAKNEYPLFFRHYPEDLSEDDFWKVAALLGGISKAVGEDYEGFMTMPFYLKPKQVYISVLLPEEIQKNGYAAEIVKYAATHAFKNLEANRIVCLTVKEDSRTNELLEKAGFTKEGEMIESCYYDGHYRDEIRWGIGREEYDKRYKELSGQLQRT